MNEICFLHVHFIHTPSSVARYACAMAGKRFSISAHAKDIWTTPSWEISEKLADCEWCATCTRAGADALRSRATEAEKIHLVPHGLNLSRFPDSPNRPPLDGSDSEAPLRFLSVARAVPKKGLDSLLKALSRLPSDFSWRWRHIGSGPLSGELQSLARELGVSDRCEFSGALAQEQVISAYRESDLFVLPCRIDSSGDRDGLPNVLLEAQSQRLAVLSSSLAGVSELIRDGENGVLVEPDDVESLAIALESLGRDPSRREAMGLGGEAIVRERFDHDAEMIRLVELLKEDAGEALRS